jgi:hypothetical protein
MKQCINWFHAWFARRSKTQQQWLWFVALWCAGFLAVTIMGKIIKLMMGV